MKEILKNGGVLYTGKDFEKVMISLIKNARYVEPSCDICAYDSPNRDNEMCDGCSMANDDNCCSCHLNPPCSYCQNNHYEEYPYIIKCQFFYSREGGQISVWKGFKSDSDTYEKYKILTTKHNFSINYEFNPNNRDEIFLYLTCLDTEEEIDIDIIHRSELLYCIEKMIKNNYESLYNPF